MVAEHVHAGDADAPAGHLQPMTPRAAAQIKQRAGLPLPAHQTGKDEIRFARVVLVLIKHIVIARIIAKNSHKASFSGQRRR